MEDVGGRGRGEERGQITVRGCRLLTWWSVGGGIEERGLALLVRVEVGR